MGADSAARERIRGFIGAVERWLHAAALLRILEAENATSRRPVLGWFLDEEDDDEDARRRAEALDRSREPRVAFADVKHAHAEAEAARAAVLAQSEAVLALLRNRGIDAEAVARVVVEVEGRRVDEARRRWPRAKAALVVASATGEADAVPAEAQAAPAALRVLRVYAGKLADSRLQAALEAVESAGTVSERLAALHRALPIPPTVSAEALAEALGCDPSSVKKSEWWQTHRAGARERRAETRRDRLVERGRRVEHDG